MIVCHPLVQVVFLPKGLKSILTQAFQNVKMRNVFLYSNDGRKWVVNPDELIKELVNGGIYYMADLNLDTFFKVEEYMLEGLVSLCNRELPIVYAESYHWKNELLGEI